MKIHVPPAELARLRANMTRNAREARRDIAAEANQRSLNIAGRTFDNIKPGSGEGARTKRFEVKQYLSLILSSRLKMAQRGKRAGKFIRRGGRNRQLTRANLIVQARRAKEGKKGLYGKAMSAVTGKFVQRAQKSVGFIKSPLLPIITTLNGLCRFKFPFYKTRNISRWPKSAGYGWVRIHPGRTHTVLMEFNVDVQQNAGRVQAMYNQAVGSGIAAENLEIERHIMAREEKRAAKMNSER